jgi:ribonuclease D
MPNTPESYVRSPEALAELCAHLTEVRCFGFDTEFVGEDTYHPTLCLIQVSTKERLALIDPLAVPDLTPFWQTIRDPSNLVVVHAGRQEIALCKHYTGEPPGQFFDLQVAAGLVGFGYPLGHGQLVRQVLGVTLAKSETLTEWRTRPLTGEQIRYAYDDVRYLLRTHAALTARLEGLGRGAWVREEMDRLTQAVLQAPDAGERWRRLRGLGALSRRQLGMVRELFTWRDAKAAAENRPPRTICRDDLLIEIARKNPKQERDLHAIRGLRKREAPELLAAVECARALPAAALPPAFEREQDPPRVAVLGNLLSALLGQVCQEMALAQSLVCTTSDLRSLVRQHALGEAGEAGILYQGWRSTHIRPRLEAVLAGTHGIRVRNPRSETPFEWLKDKSEGGTTE